MPLFNIDAKESRVLPLPNINDTIITFERKIDITDFSSKF